MNYKNLFVGIDIGGTKISIVFFKNKKIIKKIRIKTNNIFGPKNIDTIIKILINYKDNIQEIGIATTGIIKDGIWSVLNKKTLGDFKDFPIVNYIKKRINKPVFAMGDTQAAALGELNYGSGKNLKNFFYITVSTGVGGSIIINNKLINEKESIVGQFGHMVIKKGGKICGCGRRGCIEAYASGIALEKELKKIKKNNITLKQMFINYKNSSWSKKIIDEGTTVIAEGIVNIYTVLGIKNFVIGGSIGLSNIFFLQLVKNIKKITKNKIFLTKAKLKNDSEVYGCLVRSLNK